MELSEDKLLATINRFSKLAFCTFDPKHLVQDLLILESISATEADFDGVIDRTIAALALLAGRQVDADALHHEYDGWLSYHYQPRIAQGQKAVYRVIFTYTDEGIDVMGFGHRHQPTDIYRRLRERLG